MEKKTIGIIGGMGPLATADLFEKIVAKQADRVAAIEAPTDEEILTITKADLAGGLEESWN